jgi:hypothetical protein
LREAAALGLSTDGSLSERRKPQKFGQAIVISSKNTLGPIERHDIHAGGRLGINFNAR